MKRILLTGKNGQVGWELQRTLAPLGHVLARDHAGLDLADADRIAAAVREVRPDIVVNAAAYTAVDKAEADIAAVMSVNATAPGVLAAEVKRLGALLIHFSTDYVFDGHKTEPYREDDVPNPVNAYGRSKLAGERAIEDSGCRHLILRTGWVYANRGHNFLRTMSRLARVQDEIRVVNDQFGAPTWCRMIAEATALMLARRPSAEGLYHLSAAGKTSWHDFAAVLLAHAKFAGRLIAIPSTSYPLPAKRPPFSVLDNAKVAADFGIALQDWQAQAALCLAESDQQTG